MAYKPVILYIDNELAKWLDEKVNQGYKKASLIRKILDDYRKSEVIKDDSG